MGQALYIADKYGGLTKYDKEMHGDDILVRINCGYSQAPDWLTKNNRKVDGGYLLSGSGDYFVRVKYIDGLRFSRIAVWFSCGLTALGYAV